MLWSGGGAVSCWLVVEIEMSAVGTVTKTKRGVALAVGWSASLAVKGYLL